VKTLSIETEKCFSDLKNYFLVLESAAVAWSGGVDSTLLLYVASLTPGFTAKTALMPDYEIASAITLGEKFRITHNIINLDILSFKKITDNSRERCYHCKTIILSRIISEATEQKITTVLEGSHLGDDKDYRPGIKAINELGVKSPLKDCGFDKSRIYELSAYLNLPTSEKDSYPCLATRIPYGTQISLELLKKATQAEVVLSSFGFRNIRARIHGDILRIEVAENMIPELTSSPTREKVCSALLETGFTYITLDLQGYRTGSMNLKIEEPE